MQAAAPAPRLAVLPPRLLLALFTLSWLQSCGGPPPPPPPPAPTIAKLSLTAAADANATQSGQGAPIIIRVYQLASTAAFEKAEFFQLLNSDTALLGADAVSREEYLLAPGTTKTEELAVTDRVQAIGVFAAYREFTARTWRVVVPVPPHKTTTIAVSVTAGGLVVAK